MFRYTLECITLNYHFAGLVKEIFERQSVLLAGGEVFQSKKLVMMSAMARHRLAKTAKTQEATIEHLVVLTRFLQHQQHMMQRLFLYLLVIGNSVG